VNKTYVRKVLENPHDRLWTVQGFGKMATNITENARLHVWDRVLVEPRVPAIHSHSWDFKSTILAGRMRNLRFREIDGVTWNRILVSSAGAVMGPTERAALTELPLDIYGEGESYVQTSEEIHLSLPEDGTATLVEWQRESPERLMRIFWRGNRPWEGAKPRRATAEEIRNVTQNVLDTWFEGSP